MHIPVTPHQRECLGKFNPPETRLGFISEKGLHDAKDKLRRFQQSDSFATRLASPVLRCLGQEFYELAQIVDLAVPVAEQLARFVKTKIAAVEPEKVHAQLEILERQMTSQLASPQTGLRFGWPRETQEKALAAIETALKTAGAARDWERVRNLIQLDTEEIHRLPPEAMNPAGLSPSDLDQTAARIHAILSKRKIAPDIRNWLESQLDENYQLRGHVARLDPAAPAPTQHLDRNVTPGREPDSAARPENSRSSPADPAVEEFGRQARRQFPHVQIVAGPDPQRISLRFDRPAPLSENQIYNKDYTATLVIEGRLRGGQFLPLQSRIEFGDNLKQALDSNPTAGAVQTVHRRMIESFSMELRQMIAEEEILFAGVADGNGQSGQIGGEFVDMRLVLLRGLNQLLDAAPTAPPPPAPPTRSFPAGERGESPQYRFNL